ncbi:MAG: NfeD family protein [Bacteroidales bacterium]|nr:NfeD family protein [Bacteroidales bacterium]
MTWIIFLIIIGLLLLIVEFLLIPGITIAGIAGFGFIGFGIFKAYADHGTMAGHLTLIFTAIASVITIALSLRAKTWRRVTLNNKIDSKAVENYEDKIKVGDTGVSISRLAPMGKANINNEMVEVTAYGQLIDQNTPIVVVRVEENKIIVKPKTE